MPPHGTPRLLSPSPGGCDSTIPAAWQDTRPTPASGCHRPTAQRAPAPARCGGGERGGAASRGLPQLPLPPCLPPEPSRAVPSHGTRLSPPRAAMLGSESGRDDALRFPPQSPGSPAAPRRQSKESSLTVSAGAPGRGHRGRSVLGTPRTERAPGAAFWCSNAAEAGEALGSLPCAVLRGGMVVPG